MKTPDSKFVGGTLEWLPGPWNGGGGTAGGTPDAPVWRDGDLILTVVEICSGGREVAALRVLADGDMLSFRDTDDDEWAWTDGDIAWFCVLDPWRHLPPPP